jgi:hypothetical protein
MAHHKSTSKAGGRRSTVLKDPPTLGPFDASSQSLPTAPSKRRKTLSYMAQECEPTRLYTFKRADCIVYSCFTVEDDTQTESEINTPWETLRPSQSISQVATRALHLPLISAKVGNPQPPTLNRGIS